VDNPKENQLPPGALTGYLNEAVRRSGYPLQTVIATELQKTFVVTEEWGYQDRTTQEQRTLDVFAFKRLREENRAGVLVAPSVVLLVECKRSQHPFIFFKSETEKGRALSGFPRICGLGPVVVQQNDSSRREVSPCECLGLETEPFSISRSPICTTLARAGAKPEDGSHRRKDSEAEPVRKGIVLTGSDAYNSILLPLASSLDFLGGYYSGSGQNVSPVIAFAVCVLDAHMVLSEGGPEDSVLSMVPWVRLIRRENKQFSRGYRHTQHVVDFVHRYALSDFVSEILQFADIVRERFIEKAGVFQRGRGIVKDLNNWKWSEVQPS
jgi:hypothetical protein